MGVVAYTLVRTDHRKVQRLVDRIGSLRFVKEVKPVYGEYNLIVKTETESIKELTLLIYNKLRTISGLTRTTTMITAKINKK